jgi:hypothetical protein
MRVLLIALLLSGCGTLTSQTTKDTPPLVGVGAAVADVTVAWEMWKLMGFVK